MEKWLSIVRTRILSMIIITFFTAACVIIITLAITKNKKVDLTDPIAQRIYATSKLSNNNLAERALEKIFELEKKKEDNK